ncbi:MAG: Crp/Fnr family transcriptional regulator [Nitrospinota bacterium]|jgi:CRP-like cAMP-binding protein
MTNKWFLRRIQIFSKLSDKELEKFLGILSEKTYKDGEIIFHKDDPGSSLFILKSGLVKISINDKKGNEYILKIMYPFDFFGEMALLDGQSRSATVTSLEISTALIIKREHFISLIEKHPQIALSIMAVLSRRLRKTDEKIGNLRFADAYGKVAEIILDIADESGIRNKSGIVLNLKLSRQGLADFAGVSRETVTRILNEFKKSGCIKMEKGKITILNEAMLRRELI